MRPSLSLVTAPASEPVTLAEAKAWARIDSDDEDATITALIAAARSAAEEFLCRSLVSQTWKLTLDLTCSAFSDLPEGVYDLPVTALYGGLPSIIPLPRGPVQSITSVTTYGLDNTSAVYGASNYRVDTSGDRLILNYGATWPSNLRPQAAVEIRYAAGYTSIPQPIKTGLLIHVASLYEQRGICEDAMALPPGSKQLYGHYRIMGGRLG